MIIQYTGQLLIDKSCDFRRGLQELVCKPKAFIELSLGLEDRLEAAQLQVLRLYRKEQIDLDHVAKTSKSALGLASWLHALSEFTHHTGLMKKAKFVPTNKKQTGNENKHGWQYSTNADQLNDEVIMRMPKWARENLEEGSSMQHPHEMDVEECEEIDYGKDDYQQEVIQPKEIGEETQELIE